MQYMQKNIVAKAENTMNLIKNLNIHEIHKSRKLLHVWVQGERPNIFLSVLKSVYH